MYHRTGGPRSDIGGDLHTAVYRAVADDSTSYFCKLRRDVFDQISMDFVLCHSDLHPGNLFIVDWDYPIRAPKECDLMFIGGGQGFMPYIAEHEELLFYRGYGQAQLDSIGLAYYRYERGITDITVECERVFSRTLGHQDRAQALEILQLYFLPGCTIEMAYKSDATR